MHKKLLLSMIVLMSLFFFIALYLLGKNNSKAQELNLEIPVIAKQLKDSDGNVPVKLICDKAELALPNVTKKINCKVNNITKKSITSLVLVYEFLLDANGEQESFSGVLTIDMLFHPDLVDLRKHSFIKPNESSPISILPSTFDPMLQVQKVTIRIDYIEFENKETIVDQNDGQGRILLNEFREGINAYRNFLMEKTLSKKNNYLEDILSGKIMADENNFNSLTSKQKEGMNAFRNYINRIYKDKGLLEAKKFVVDTEVKNEN